MRHSLQRQATAEPQSNGRADLSLLTVGPHRLPGRQHGRRIGNVKIAPNFRNHGQRPCKFVLALLSLLVIPRYIERFVAS